MKRNLIKLWSIVSLSLLCIFVYSIYANRALRHSKEALEKLYTMETRLDRMESNFKATDHRIEMLEDLVLKLQEVEQSNHAATNHDGIFKIPDNASGLLEKQPSLEESKAVVQRSMDPDAVTALGNPADTFVSFAQRQMEVFRQSLNQTKLLELSNRVENAVVESFSTASKLGNFSEEQELQIIEFMDNQQLELIRKAHEDSVLMQMMVEQAQREMDKQH